MSDRAELIVKYFDYLINEFGFYIERKEFDPQAMGNAIVIFKSQKLGVEVVVDRNMVLISLGDQIDSRRDWFEFSDVIKYYAPKIDGVYVFEKNFNTSWDQVVETQLSKLAIILRQNCESILKGEQLNKKEVRKIEEKRVAENFEK